MQLQRRGYLPMLLLAGCLLTGCAGLMKGQPDFDVGVKERGIASWYGDDFHGWVTASGEPYDMYALTAAHRTLPLGTVVRVTNVINARHVIVRINDRGPYVNGRILDLSYAAAERLHMVTDGVSAIQLQVIGHHSARTVMEASALFRDLPSAASDARDALPVRQPSFPQVRARVHGPRAMPADLLMERRPRRVADILATACRVDAAAILA